jgi:outer membrane protein OmpA-like peptidoglycan-associated protein
MAPKAQDSPASNDPDILLMSVMAIVIDTRLAVMCGIPDTKVFFKFDSATVRPDAKELLDKISTCAQSGPAKGKGLRVIGRTDPRGSESYNMKLGKDRAETVAKYLREQGVVATRTEIISKGEVDRNADDPWGWPYSRRVTILLDGEG